MISPNARALLDTIALAEGTSGPNGYQTMFTGRLFNDLSKHPRQLNRSNGYESDAAGRYQFLSTTWDGVARPLGLTDFSPASQDRAALELIRRRGVDPDKPLDRAALNRLAPEWASLPTLEDKSYYGQPVKAADKLLNFYNQRLGSSSGALAGSPSTGGGVQTPQVSLSAFNPGALAAQLLGALGSAGGSTPGLALPTPQSVSRPAPRSVGELAAGILDTSFAQEAGVAALTGRTRMAADSRILPSLAAAALAPSGVGRSQVDALLKATLPQVGAGGFSGSAMPDLSSIFAPLGGGASGASPAPVAGGTTNGPIRLGRISGPGEDPLPSTGPHLDVRIQKPDGTYINPETARSMLTNLRVGGKPLYSQQGGEWLPSFPVTSGYGPRAAPTAGASTYHRGLDFGVPAGTPIEWHGTPGRFSYAGGIGTLELPDGYRIKTLHTSS